MTRSAERFAMPLRAFLWTALAPDAVLALAWIWLLLAHPVTGRLRLLLLVAIPLVVAYGLISLQYPSEVLLDEEAVTFRAWGRAHSYRWAEVAGTVRVRAFLVRDRVYVRIGPFHPWRGRYWLTDRIERFPELVERIRARALAGRGAAGPG